MTGCAVEYVLYGDQTTVGESAVLLLLGNRGNREYVLAPRAISARKAHGAARFASWRCCCRGACSRSGPTTGPQAHPDDEKFLYYKAEKFSPSGIRNVVRRSWPNLPTTETSAMIRVPRYFGSLPLLPDSCLF